MGDTSQDADTNTGAVRDELVNAAVKFLQHPKVKLSSLENREAFLRKKGLSEKEIGVAFERSLASLPPPVQQIPQQQFQTNPPQHTAVSIPEYYLPPAPTRWGRFIELLNSFALVSGLIYGLYLLYKKYIAKFLFGSPKKQPALQDCIRELDESVTTSVLEIKSQLQTVQTEVQKISEHQEMKSNQAVTNRQMQELKNEVISLKGLLLNRNQFTSSSLEPPSIPAWQLVGEEEEEVVKTVPTIKGGMTFTGADDAKQAVANGSDSSLEMIKESPVASGVAAHNPPTSIQQLTSSE